MATANSSRGTRRSGRLSGGNRPRTHPTTAKPRRKPVAPSRKALIEGKAQADALLQAAQAAEPARGIARSPAADPMPSATLRDIRDQLTIVRSVVYTAARALVGQCADNDDDVAVTLQRCVGDEVDRQIERIDGLIGGGAA